MRLWLVTRLGRHVDAEGVEECPSSGGLDEAALGAGRILWSTCERHVRCAGVGDLRIHALSYKCRDGTWQTAPEDIEGRECVDPDAGRVYRGDGRRAGGAPLVLADLS